jgi:hypothetical protein
MIDYLRRHHLALIALFFALSGTSYAVARGSIDSREIKDGAIRGVDVRNGGLGTKDVRTGSLGGGDIANGTVRDADLGRNSVDGDEVVNGSLTGADLGGGALGTNAVVRFDSATVAPGQIATLGRRCERGERALGGGVSLEPPNPADRIVFSEPRAEGNRIGRQAIAPTGWAAAIANGDPANARTATVWAVCASR